MSEVARRSGVGAQATRPVDLDIGIVHDYLTQKGGAERVVLELLRAFPQAPLYTALYEPSATFDAFADHEVRTSRINRVARLRRSHRLAFPVLAPAFSRLQVRHDVVICSSSGWAHGAKVDGIKVVYCHAPARWLHQSDRYTAGSTKTRLALATLRRPLMAWDEAAMRSADVLLANSLATRRAIDYAYGLEAEVLYPPHAAPLDAVPEPIEGIEPGFFLVVSRLLPYKNVDAVVAAFAELPEHRLVVAGTGPEAERLRAAAGPNVTLVGEVSEAQLAWLYESCRSLVAASYEDFGLTPLEAAAFGKPTAALHFGGYRETVLPEKTGVFFERPEPRLIADAIHRIARRRWSAKRLHQQADTFSPGRFRDALRARLEHLIS